MAAPDHRSSSRRKICNKCETSQTNPSRPACSAACPAIIRSINRWLQEMPTTMTTTKRNRSYRLQNPSDRSIGCDWQTVRCHYRLGGNSAHTHTYSHPQIHLKSLTIFLTHRTTSICCEDHRVLSIGGSIDGQSILNQCNER
ncbi:unnamed protein product [Soboliphyme baturini]|uniref:Uncharacterized protein n=1 Tax=Soboliphyme baturini TaxID=241478 RepID=A0A183IK34_9BILA|nr:unnamed protein product [Soboliphyme baturini]